MYTRHANLGAYTLQVELALNNAICRRFIVEAKAIALHSKLHYATHQETSVQRIRQDDDDNRATEVLVTIGLFSITRLFRLVNLSVESRGFDVPGECEQSNPPISPCEYFEELDFPMDIFAPPQKPEFMAGISMNISRKK